MLNSLVTAVSRVGTLFGVRNHSSTNAMSLLHDVDVPTKKATFAMACFWAPDSVFGATPGVIRTRVGYAGGSKEGPTYRSLGDDTDSSQTECDPSSFSRGDHTESIQIEFDPSSITYNTLLDVFWKNHDATARTSRQYTSLIFYHNDEQKSLAEKSLEEQKSKHRVVTEILPAGKFWDAEDYHQKYRLQQHDWLMNAIGMKRGSQLKTSHLAARLNGYCVGRGGIAQFESDIARLGLSDEIADYVRKLVIKYENAGPFC